MEDIIKMVGYFVIGSTIIILGYNIFMAIAEFLLALTTTPIGILILLIAGLAILRFASK